MLAGACLSRAGLNRTTALATATVALAAEAPDIDVVMNFLGPVTGFAHHRGFTHTLMGVPLVAAAAAGVIFLVSRMRRKPNPHGLPARWGLLYLYACLAGLLHILLDFTNNYGVRPLAPFEHHWYSWDIVFILEPLVTLPLLAALVMPSLFRLIQEEIGARQKGPRGRGWAIAALIFVALVWGVRDYQHRRALTAMESALYQGQEPVRVAAYPYPLNPFKWHGVVETEGFFQSFLVDSLRPEVDPQGRAVTIYKPEETDVTLAAKRSRLGRVYLDWAEFPVTETEQLPREGGYLVRFYDLRFVYPDMRRRPLTIAVELDRELKVTAMLVGRRAQQHLD